MMSVSTRQELTQRTEDRSRRSSDLEKRRILDDFVATTGYHLRAIYAEVIAEKRRGPAKNSRATAARICSN